MDAAVFQAQISSRLKAAAADARSGSPEAGFVRRDELFADAYQKAERGQDADSENGVKNMVQVCKAPLSELSETVGASIKQQLKDAYKSALDALEAEFEKGRTLLKGGGGSDVVLGRVTTRLAAVLEDFSAAAFATADESLELIERGHARAVQALEGRAAGVVNEVISTTKDDLQTRHGWKAAQVVKKLAGARMSAKSAHAKEIQQLVHTHAQREAELLAQLDIYTNPEQHGDGVARSGPGEWRNGLQIWEAAAQTDAVTDVRTRAQLTPCARA